MQTSADLARVLQNCRAKRGRSAPLSYPIISGWIRGQREMDDVRKCERIAKTLKKEREEEEKGGGLWRGEGVPQRQKDGRRGKERRARKVSGMMCQSNAERWRK